MRTVLLCSILFLACGEAGELVSTHLPVVVLSGSGGGSGGGSEMPDAGEPDSGVPDAGQPVMAAQLGTGDHTAASVTLTEIAGFASGLRRPRDLAFNTRIPDELWAVNYDDNSVVVVFDASQSTRTTRRLKDGYAVHFMERPSSIAFGADATTIGKPGTFATCQESRNTYGGAEPHNDFMGPALWSSDLTVFAQSNPIGLGAHLDMLHGSPNCMGIAHERDNIYWVFGGKRQSGTSMERQQPMPAIVKYNFNRDHGIGLDDHADGEIYQYAEMQVLDVPGVPSHLVFEQSTKLLFIADTGNHRIVTLDTTTGMRIGTLQAQEPLRAYDRMGGATMADVVPASSGHLLKPSGLELHDGFIYVSDNENSRISAFDRMGNRVNWLDTGLPAGSLAGITFGPDGRLYFIDMLGNRVLRIDPK